MRFGISAGGLVVEENKLLLVHHYREREFDFWVPPGGRVEGYESVFDCAARETLEETGLEVEPERILYIQEFVEPGYHFVKFFIQCDLIGGQITDANQKDGEDFLVEIDYFSQQEIAEINVHPEILKDRFWRDKDLKEAGPFYLPMVKDL